MRECGSCKTKEKRSEENTATKRENRQKFAFAIKQTHTLEEEVQETTATECQDRQNCFRISKNTMYFAFQQT